MLEKNFRIQKIGVTERADPTVNKDWKPWVEKGYPAILITKMPRLLVTQEDLTGKENIIIHCTITGLGGTRIESKIDSPEVSLLYYHLLCNLFGSKRVVLRIDPIIPGYTDPEVVKSFIKEAEGRIRISFLDLYPHVVKKLLTAVPDIVFPSSFNYPLPVRKALWEYLGKPEVCGESGLPSIPCISKLDCEVLEVVPSTHRKGQRSVCNCLSNKFELCTYLPRCTYKCLYCYWKY